MPRLTAGDRILSAPSPEIAPPVERGSDGGDTVAYEDALAQPHARKMDFTGRPMRGMVYVSEQGVEDDSDLASWIDRGARFAGSLPPR